MDTLALNTPHSGAERSLPAALPPGTPAWITSELVALTLKVWQPRYAVQLTMDDTIEILVAAGRLLAVLRPHAAPSESLADSARAV